MKFSKLSLGILAAAAIAVPALAQAPATSIWDGVYSEAQATRGQGTYTGECSACHGESPFIQRFDNQTAADAYTFISTMMPEGAGGTLSPRAYADILAYLLQFAGLPAGTADLPADAEALAGIRMNFTR